MFTLFLFLKKKDKNKHQTDQTASKINSHTPCFDKTKAHGPLSSDFAYGLSTLVKS